MMSRLIDADSIKSAKYHDLPYTHIHPVGVDVQAYEMGWNDALDAAIESAPSVDAEPVRHGHWINDFSSPLKCSSCGIVSKANEFTLRTDFKFCPYCGAKMDEVDT